MDLSVFTFTQLFSKAKKRCSRRALTRDPTDFCCIVLLVFSCNRLERSWHCGWCDCIIWGKLPDKSLTSAAYVRVALVMTVCDIDRWVTWRNNGTQQRATSAAGTAAAGTVWWRHYVYVSSSVIWNSCCMVVIRNQSRSYGLEIVFPLTKKDWTDMELERCTGQVLPSAKYRPKITSPMNAPTCRRCVATYWKGQIRRSHRQSASYIYHKIYHRLYLPQNCKYLP